MSFVDFCSEKFPILFHFNDFSNIIGLPFFLQFCPTFLAILVQIKNFWTKIYFEFALHEFCSVKFLILFHLIDFEYLWFLALFQLFLVICFCLHPVKDSPRKTTLTGFLSLFPKWNKNLGSKSLCQNPGKYFYHAKVQAVRISTTFELS